MYWLSVSVVTACLLASTFGFPTGAPDDACLDLTPGHPNSILSNNTITNEYVIVVMEGHENQYYVVLGGPPFKGMVLRVDGGELTPVDNNTQKISCPETTTFDAITHTNSDDRSAIVASWMPDSSGSFNFRATVVKDFTAHVMDITKDVTVE